MAFSVSYIYEILDRYSAPLRAINRKTDQFDKTVKKTNFSLKTFGQRLRSIGSEMRSFGLGMTAGLTLIGAGLAGMALKASANMETMKVQFEVMLDSADKAKQMIADLTQYSKDTPFELPGVTKAAKVMLGYGFEQEQVIKDMKMLGDISAGSGKNLSELAVIYGQVKNAGRLMGQEALQFVNAGVPLNKELAKIISEKLGISIKKATPLIKKMGEKGEISFEMVRRAMYNMRKEGGVFFDMTDRLAMTLAGKWAKVSENFSLFLIDIGDLIVRVSGLKGGLDDLNVVLETAGEKINAWTEANPQLTKLILIVTGLILVLGPLLIIIGFVAQGVGALATLFGFLSWPILAVVAGVVALAAAFHHWFKSGHPVTGLLKQLWASTGKLLSAFWNLASAAGGIIRKIFGIKEETGTLAGVFDRVGYILMPIVDTLTLAFTGLATGINFISDLIEGDLIGAFNGLQKAGDSIKENFRGLYEAIRPVFYFIWDVMAEIEKAFDKLAGYVDKIANLTKIFRDEGFTAGSIEVAKIHQKMFDFGGAAKDTGEANATATARKNNISTTVNAQGMIKVMSDDKTNIVDSMIQLNEGENLAMSY